MKIYLFFSVFFSAILLQSCSSGSNKSKNAVVSQTRDSILPEKFPTGEVIEQVVCKNDASQSYAMYLPSSSSPEKKYPIIYAFDPHGTGKLPVSLYKDLAEHYGFILVASNNSKNGTTWEESQTIAEKLFSDTWARLSINTDRIYALGFSGGARVANGLTITNGSIRGVICCGAAAPAVNSTNPRGGYSFIGIVGNEDFNYIEMRKYDMLDLAGHNVKHAQITFNGKHEWPSKEVMDEAFWWLELNEMRQHITTKNDSLVSTRIQPLIKQVEIAMQKKDVFEAYNVCRKAIIFYDGLADLSYCLETYKSLQKNVEVDKELKLESILWKKEEDLKQYYIQAFQTKELAWWQKEISDLNKKIKTGKDKNEALMYKRTLGFLSLAAYMQSSGALKQNAIPVAEMFCKIYLLVDPTNKEAYYLTASVNAKEGKTTEAIQSLNAAIKNGFTDSERLQNDSAFYSMKSRDDFNGLIEELKDKEKNK